MQLTCEVSLCNWLMKFAAALEEEPCAMLPGKNTRKNKKTARPENDACWSFSPLRWFGDKWPGTLGVCFQVVEKRPTRKIKTIFWVRSYLF